MRAAAGRFAVGAQPPSATVRNRGAIPSLALILGIATAAFAPGSAAATLYVNGAVSSSGDGSSWSQAHKTITEGLGAAAFGESVFVAEGRYCENLAMRSGVAVYGGFAEDGSQNAPAERDLLRRVSLIDGMGGRVVLFDDVGSATLDGFSITGGNAIAGGGICFFNPGWTPAHAHEGNILAHCRIFGNTAWLGGGISCTISFPLITNCLITGNAATAPDPISYYGGGGINVQTFSPLILNCTISDNVSYGGWAPTYSYGWGGGIMCGTGSATPKIVNTILTGNTSFAIYENSVGDPTVSYTLFHANPDGAYRDFVGPDFDDAVEYLDSEIEELEANVPEATFLLSGDPLFIGGPGGSWDAAGGVVYDAASSSTLLTDSSASFPTTWTLATKLINPNLAQELQTMITSNTATVISLAGDFTDRAAAGDAYQVYDYHILSGSPCIDAALTTSTLFDDLDGRPRPFDGPGEGFDVGAYEYCPFLPLVSFVSTQTVVQEAATTVGLTVALSPHLIPVNVTVDWNVIGGTATVGADLQYLASGTLSLNSSSATSAVIPIEILDDPLFEPAETAILELSNPTNATLGIRTTHTLAILDDDTPAASFAHPSASVGEDAGAVLIEVGLSRPAGPSGGSVDYAVVGGTAAGGADFNLLGSGTLFFNPSSSLETIGVQIVDDANMEDNETVVIGLSNPSSMTLGLLPTFTLTIVDNDLPLMYFTSSSRTVEESAGIVEVRIMVYPRALAGGASVDLAFSGTAVGGGVDYELIGPTTLSFGPSAPAGVFEIDIIDDAVREAAETIVIELRNPVDAILANPSAHTIRIEDNEVVTHASPSPEGNGSFGFAVSDMPDTSASRGLIAIGAYNEDGGEEPPDSGRVYIVDARNRSVKKTLESPNPQKRGQFGRSLAGIADATRDQLGDLVVGAPAESLPGSPPEAGAAYIFDGHTGALTHALTSQNGETGGNFGFAVSGLGSPEKSLRRVLVGSYGERVGSLKAAGRVHVFNSENGFPLAPLVSPNAQKDGFFGYAVANLPDVDGDGYEDFVVGAPGENRVYVYNGVTRRVLRAIQGRDGGYFGISVSGMRDVSGDLRGDIIVGADCAAAGSGLICPGRAYVFCGRSGGLLRTLQSPNQMDYGLFGQVVAGIPDVNNDGLWDIAVGAQLESFGGGPEYAGRVYLFDGGSGVPVDTLVSPNEQEDGRFGCDVSGIEDLNGDGLGDLIVGAYSEAAPGSVSRSGQAYAFILDYSSTPPPPPTRPPASSRHWQEYR